ncbi:MAG: hypothetical protein WCK75_10545 [Elusimicrobiota bacterium]
MTIEAQAIDFHNEKTDINIDRLPDYCPSCHHKIEPKIFAKLLSGDGAKSDLLQIVCRCPNQSCGISFFGIYAGVPQSGSGHQPTSWYFFKRSLPGSPLPPVIPEMVGKLSQKFSEIMRQAAEAEFYSLNQVAGPGYRKALEFLIKDFVISRADKLGTNKEMVSKMQLGQCINDFIIDPMVKKTAQRAAWLGNDETHYLRLWGEKDISDLKTLIKLACNGIDNQILAEEYEKSMGKKAP